MRETRNKLSLNPKLLIRIKLTSIGQLFDINFFKTQFFAFFASIHFCYLNRDHKSQLASFPSCHLLFLSFLVRDQSYSNLLISIAIRLGKRIVFSSARKYLTVKEFRKRACNSIFSFIAN